MTFLFQLGDVYCIGICLVDVACLQIYLIKKKHEIHSWNVSFRIQGSHVNVMEWQILMVGLFSSVMMMRATLATFGGDNMTKGFNTGGHNNKTNQTECHLASSSLANIGSADGLSLVWCQAITWTNADILSVVPFCLGLNVFNSSLLNFVCLC